MRNLEGLSLIASGFNGFVLVAALSGLSYLVANLAARHVSSTPRKLYRARLAFMFVFLIVWWVVLLPYGARAHAGNFLDPDFWHHVARDIGIFYGAQTIWAWCIVALLEWPKKKRVPPES
jgi:hypothetical protein